MSDENGENRKLTPQEEAERITGVSREVRLAGEKSAVEASYEAAQIGLKKSSISDVFINRPVMTVLLALAAAFFGIFAYKSMPVNDLPGVDYPVIQVNVSYPGANPIVMGSNVASPLEQQFMQIPGIEMITSRNTFGATQLVLQFSLSKTLDSAATDVQSAIQRAMGNLPSDLPSPPSFTKDNPNDMPIFILTVRSRDMTAGSLYDYAFTQIAQQLNMVPGVSKVDIFSAPNSVRLEVDLQKLYNLGFTTTDLKNALAQSTNLYGTGNLQGPGKQFVLLPDTQLDKAEDYEKLVVGYKDGSPIFLRDIAKAINKIQYDTLNLNVWSRNLPDSPAYATVGMGVRKRPDGNAVTTVAGLRKLLERLRTELPSSVEINEYYDRSQLIIANIDDVRETLIIAFVLVVLVIFGFLGRIRDTTIPSVALPFSILLTFIFMYFFDFSINNLSLMGLTMAIGFLVDDAIVFLENTVRRMEDYSETPHIAAVNSAREISFTILSMTLSLAAVFIPLVFMSGIMGRVFKEFSVTIVIATLMSGLISLTMTPMMCARMLQPRTKNFSDKTAVEKFSHKLEAAFLKIYDPTLRWMLRQNLLAFLVIAGSLAGTVYLFMKLPQIFFPIGDSGFMQGAFISNTSSSPEELGKLQDKVSEVFKKNPAIKNYILVSGVTGFVNQNMGFGFVILEDKDKRPPIQEVSNQVNSRLNAIPGIVASFQPQPTLKISTGATSTTQGKYAYALTSMNQDSLYSSAQKLYQKLAANKNLFSSVQTDLYLDNPQITLKPYRDKAAMIGLSANNYSNAFKDAYAKLFFYLIKSPFQQYWSVMEANKDDRAYAGNLGSIMFQPDSVLTGGSPVYPLSGTDGDDTAYTLSSLIPFDAVSTTETALAPVTINHLNNFPSVTIYFDLRDGVAISEAMKWIEEVSKETLSQDIQGMFVGEAVTFADTMNSLLYLLFVAVFVMYVILGILYESYLHPITVLIAMPIAVFGGLVCLWVGDMEISIYSAIGIFMLMGIVKKNGIMMVDFAIMREAAGMSSRDAVHMASMERFRPIIMTTMAALMGMLPIALGWGKADAESRIPLGVVVVGGLVFSQIVTLYITPVVYVWIDWLQTRVLDKIPFFARGDVSQSPGD